uniref:Uncharacterized protein n=1 Tax=Lepeophtheirus salmonis TaxID=72036 RepID=A0A0K2ULZ9_LEPSM
MIISTLHPHDSITY